MSKLGWEKKRLQSWQWAQNKLKYWEWAKTCYNIGSETCPKFPLARWSESVSRCKTLVNQSRLVSIIKLVPANNCPHKPTGVHLGRIKQCAWCVTTDASICCANTLTIASTFCPRVTLADYTCPKHRWLYAHTANQPKHHQHIPCDCASEFKHITEARQVL